MINLEDGKGTFSYLFRETMRYRQDSRAAYEAIEQKYDKGTSRKEKWEIIHNPGT